MRTLSLVAVLLLTTAPAASALPAAPSGGASDPLPIAADLSEKVTMTAKVTRRRPRGDLVDVDVRVDVRNLPTDRTYQFLIQDLGMQRRGLKPAPVPNAAHRWRGGNLVFRFELTDYSRGEWVQCWIRSSDGAVRKTIRFVPVQ
jgi:hypothetical protein